MGYGIIFMVIDMTKKYFFFDVDGTLTTQNPGGTILPSTLKTLEKLTDKKTCLDIIEQHGKHNITFSEYPHDDKWLLESREMINEAIKAAL